ncbi:MAG: Tricarboxylate transport protein TctC [Betaproteobacteria bacterium]|nr:Tricarboxylate transport protein TctC [Betaproteobacteria bacterium]
MLRWAVLLCTCMTAGTLCAQNYPAKPIRLIVPYPPGAGTDIIARTVGQKLGEVLGQQVVVDNRGGGGGVIGADAAAKSPSDGYTMVLVTSTFAMTPALQKPPYDPVNDFTPLILLAAVPNILVVHPSLPARNIKELIALARAKPGELSYATSGNGTVSHLLTEWLSSLVGGLKLVHVPYKGNAQALTDLLGGHVSLMFSALPSAMPHLTTGRVRAIAITSKTRTAAVPQVPTFIESGVPDFVFSSEFGLLMPAKTPREIVTRLNTEIVKILRLPDVRERLATQGAQPVGNSPEEYGTLMKADIARWVKIVQSAGIRAD